MSEREHYHCPTGCEHAVFQGEEHRCVYCGAIWVLCTPETCPEDETAPRRPGVG